jgi:hypothetical protein
MSKIRDGMSDSDFYNFQKRKQQDHYKEIMEIRESAKSERRKNKKDKTMWTKFKQFFLGA